jgi:hypothetical protein
MHRRGTGNARHRQAQIQRLVLVSAGVPAAIELAARRGLTTPAEWARRALLNALEGAGVHLSADGRITTAVPNTNVEEEQRA